MFGNRSWKIFFSGYPIGKYIVFLFPSWRGPALDSIENFWESSANARISLPRVLPKRPSIGQGSTPEWVVSIQTFGRPGLFPPALSSHRRLLYGQWLVLCPSGNRRKEARKRFFATRSYDGSAEHARQAEAQSRYGWRVENKVVAAITVPGDPAHIWTPVDCAVV